MPRPNITIPAEVPADFPAFAARLGYTPIKMLWLLAEDLCADPPGEIHMVTKAAVPPNVIPFRTAA